MSNDPATQADLFGTIEVDAGPSADGWSGIDPSPSLAIPCGFRNRRNAPCRRLRTRPVMIDGEPFEHRGCRVVHCDPACFRDDSVGSGGDRPFGVRRAGEGVGSIG